ncbi:hypothetical protein FHR92_002172 [Fontibacillus solani]|uniref:Uncharacterized protein n=1 Tax=Fontibacillus solani TaxID=1572857 RepID=A0A7W3ST59_9BACL|nr:hypothetical protein [Fontibacillus solani]
MCEGSYLYRYCDHNYGQCDNYGNTKALIYVYSSGCTVDKCGEC